VAGEPVLLRVELAFRTTDDEPAQAVGDRIREAVAMIVGRDALEEFRIRSLPLTQKKGPRAID
jgi:hypothetical protein